MSVRRCVLRISAPYAIATSRLSLSSPECASERGRVVAVVALALLVALTLTTGSASAAEAPGDFNGDGFSDLAVGGTRLTRSWAARTPER